MNELEAYLVELLQGNIVCDDVPVQVVKHYSQAPQRPVITLDLSNGVNAQHVYNNPAIGEKYMEYHANVNVNVWCDTEQQRQYLTNRILELFYNEGINHYMYCSNYNKDNNQCSFLGERCPASNTPAPRRNRCPHPDTYGYESLQYKHGIIQGTLNMNPPFELDELGEHPPLLRSILQCECQYSIVVSDGYNPVEDVQIEYPLLWDDNQDDTLPDEPDDTNEP